MEELKKQLKAFELSGSLVYWVDDQIPVGRDWQLEIRQKMNSALVIVMLITDDFLSSQFIRTEEVPIALEKRNTRDVLIYPIIIGPSAWKDIPWLNSIQCLTQSNGEPFSREIGEPEREALVSTASAINKYLVSREKSLPGVVGPGIERQEEIFGGWDLRSLARARLNFKRIALERDFRWSQIRWKALYTLSRDEMKTASSGTASTLLEAIRKVGEDLASRVEKKRLNLKDWCYRAFGKEGESITQLPFCGQICNIPGASLSLMQRLEVARRLWGGTVVHPALNPECLERIFHHEALVYALFHIKRKGYSTTDMESLILRSFEDKTNILYTIICELTIANFLRNIDNIWNDDINISHDTRDLSFDSVLKYFTRQPGRFVPSELEYLFRWPESMRIIMINDEAVSARSIGGPYPDKPKHNVSYSSFAQSAQSRGIELLIANYKDIKPESIQNLDQGCPAWTFEDERWKPVQKCYAEFFYDKFPSEDDAMLLKEAIRNQAKVKIWNRVTFTLFIADKAKIYDFLTKYNVPTLGPTHSIQASTAEEGRPLRKEILASFESHASAGKYRYGYDFACIVAKPRRGYAGKGCIKLTPGEFLEWDCSGDFYRKYGGVAVQPFFESRDFCGVGSVTGRHDLRIVVVGQHPIFGMVRELERNASDEAWVASLSNIERYGGRRFYLPWDQLMQKSRITDLIKGVNIAIKDEFGSAPTIFSVDIMAVGPDDYRIVELNSKPSQIWDPQDREGGKYIRKFHDAIIEEFERLYDF